MRIYKRVFLTTLGSGLLLTGCKFGHRPMSGVVQSIDGVEYYIDTNGDTFTDRAVHFNNWLNRPEISDYIQVGDTLKFHTNSSPKLVAIHGWLDSVNNRSYQEIQSLYRTNQQRRAMGLPKLR
ncbi:MAG: hypothetical protein IJD52_00835 [Alphaproteobacteria bacterium]|nr:hypothetical protein [Alphaproteobacteria bacterium]